MIAREQTDMTAEAYDSFQNIEEYKHVGEGISSDYWEGILADEQWYNENRPNPPATYMLIAEWKIKDLSPTSWVVRPQYTFSRTEWNSYVKWNKEHE